MPLSQQLARLFEVEAIESPRQGLYVGLAAGPEDVRAAQRLRHKVFVEEMGAHVECAEPGIESDDFDPYCQHLLVRRRDSGEVVGSYRLLTDVQAARAGGYYSETEFDLTRIRALPGRVLEVGRTCVHPDYRTGSTIALLWQGLARFIVLNRIDYLMGCASIPLTTGTHKALAVYEQLARTHLAPAEWRVQPRHPLPCIQLADRAERPEIPPLLKGYLRAGAVVCGEPAWDPEFNVADLFVLLRTDALSARYTRHFLNRA